jgi:septum site-determining protein MinC
MTMPTAAKPHTQTPAFSLKGSLYTLTSLQLYHTAPQHIAQQLIAKIQQAPKFFQAAPILIDVHALANANSLDLAALKALLIEQQLVPVGIQGAPEPLKAQARELGLAIFPESKAQPPAQPATEPTQNHAIISEQAISGSPTRVVTQPVRSGQQIYAPGGDLLVLAPVSHGAEVLADGHIHVFGPLRGRALAGVTGDERAMIFCKSLEAELISIAGQYKISEDLKDLYWKKPVRISLSAARLCIDSL